MDRLVNYKYSELIGYSFSIIPDKIVDRIKYTHFLTGTDPIYAGLHNYRDTIDNRSYRNTPHVTYPYHQRISKHTTIVLPSLVAPCVVIHELGHVLDESLNFTFMSKPSTEYAKTNRGESFAEAFTSWLFWDYGNLDFETEYFLESLCI